MIRKIAACVVYMQHQDFFQIVQFFTNGLGYVTPYFYESLDYRYIYLAGDSAIQNRRQSNLLGRFQAVRSLLEKTIVDKTKGLLKLMERPLRPSETIRGIQAATNMYGTETLSMHLFYDIDYDAGYETAGDVPRDLREAIAKSAAIALLNVVGDGLMSGFSSSSLSMDGLSESFSSTQSATSAYFGARVKVYQDELKEYIADNQRKFGHIPIGCL